MVYSSSDDVFRHFAGKFGVDGDGDINAFALFAYALVESDRFDWIDHVREQSGSAPSDEKAVEWFQGKPESYFDDKERVAVRWFMAFARLMLDEEIEHAKQAAVAETVGSLGRFWPGFWTGNLIGVTSNIAFAALVVLFVLVINTDFSFAAWAKRLFGFH